MASPVSAIFWPTSLAVVCCARTVSGGERSRATAATMAEITLLGMDSLLAGISTTLAAISVNRDILQSTGGRRRISWRGSSGLRSLSHRSSRPQYAVVYIRGMQEHFLGGDSTRCALGDRCLVVDGLVGGDICLSALDRTTKAGEWLTVRWDSSGLA